MKLVCSVIILVWLSHCLCFTLPTKKVKTAAGRPAHFLLDLFQDLSQPRKQKAKIQSGKTCTSLGFDPGCCDSGPCYIEVENCYCDQVCHKYGDCCLDVEADRECPTSKQAEKVEKESFFDTYSDLLKSIKYPTANEAKWKQNAEKQSNIDLIRDILGNFGETKQAAEVEKESLLDTYSDLLKSIKYPIANEAKREQNAAKQAEEVEKESFLDTYSDLLKSIKYPTANEAKREQNALKALMQSGLSVEEQTDLNTIFSNLGKAAKNLVGGQPEKPTGQTWWSSTFSSYPGLPSSWMDSDKDAEMLMLNELAKEIQALESK